MARNKFARGKLHIETDIYRKKQKMPLMSVLEKVFTVRLVEASFSILEVGECFCNLTTYDMRKNCDICTEYCKISVQKHG